MEKSSAVSARKFRPQTFSQIVGQKHIVRTLSNALDRDRIAHAYLFSGTRGVGKTTTARVLAKALNCENGPTSEPCLKCGNCIEIAAGTALDVMEIDGASNTGVDNIRDLKENVMFSPTKSRYKIYIIDEVHQISKSAFNALLKTLEEPPPHVIFIFATTELVKVPETILSRCQCFEYKPISLNDIIQQLNMIAETEGVKATPGAIEAVARRAGGSMRDAQSMFDQSAAYGGGEVNEDDVKLILGLVEKTVLFDVIDAIISANRGALLSLAASVGASGSAPGLFLEDLATTVRNIMVAKLRPEDLTSVDEKERERLSGWAAKIDFDEIHRYFAVITHTLERIRYSTQPQIALEMGMLRMVEGRGLVSLDNLLQNVNNARANAERSQPQQQIASPPTYNAPAPVAPETQPAMFDGPPVESNLEPAPQEIQKAVSGQDNVDLGTAIKRSVKPMLASILDHATIQLKGDVVVITVNDLYQREQLDDAESRSKLEEACRGALGRDARVVIEYHDEKKKESEPAGDVLKDRGRGIKKQVMDMPIIQDAMEIFNGEISDFRVKRQM